MFALRGFARTVGALKSDQQSALLFLLGQQVAHVLADFSAPGLHHESVWA
jgi:hypothetical protein